MTIPVGAVVIHAAQIAAQAAINITETVPTQMAQVVETRHVNHLEITDIVATTVAVLGMSATTTVAQITTARATLSVPISARAITIPHVEDIHVLAQVVKKEMATLEDREVQGLTLEVGKGLRSKGSFMLKESFFYLHPPIIFT